MSNHSELDYYAILNVKRDVTQFEIAKAYRKLAIKLCPLRSKIEQDILPCEKNIESTTHMAPLPLERQWAFINMAYDVLGSELRRSIYDRLGEAGLFEGIMLPSGYFPPYQYHGDHLKVYRNAFKSYSPYSDVIDIITTDSLNAINKEKCKLKDPPIEKTICLELEEVRTGCVKLMHVWRQEFIDAQQVVTAKKRKCLTVNVPAGVTPGTRITFKEEGDRCASRIPADIIFIIEDKPHEIFKRDKLYNLKYTHKIKLGDALTGFQFVAKTLDKRQLLLTVSDIVTPGYTKVIPGEGLPICENMEQQVLTTTAVNRKRQFGKLIVEFEIIFPKHLTTEMKSECRNLFSRIYSNCVEVAK